MRLSRDRVHSSIASGTTGWADEVGDAAGVREAGAGMDGVVVGAIAGVVVGGIETSIVVAAGAGDHHDEAERRLVIRITLGEEYDNVT